MRTLLMSRTFRLAAAFMAAAIGVLLARPAAAGQGGESCARPACTKCGCQLTCGVKEEKKTVWVVKCETMCTILPGCGTPEKVCAGDGCGKCGESCAAGCDGKTNGCVCLVQPKCGRQRDIKKLEKKEIVVKRPTYTCVACGCEQGK